MAFSGWNKAYEKIGFKNVGGQAAGWDDDFDLARRFASIRWWPGTASSSSARGPEQRWTRAPAKFSTPISEDGEITRLYSARVSETRRAADQARWLVLADLQSGANFAPGADNKLSRPPCARSAGCPRRLLVTARLKLNPGSWTRSRDITVP